MTGPNHIGLEPEYFIGPRVSTLALGLCLWGLPDRQSRRSGDAYDLDEACGATSHLEQRPSTCSLIRKQHRVQGSQALTAPGDFPAYTKLSTLRLNDLGSQRSPC